MSYNVKKLQNDGKGTHYGIFINELLIHYVFSRGRALEIVEELQQGAVLIDVISLDIMREEQKKLEKLLDEELKEASDLARKLFEANKKISQLTLISSVKAKSAESFFQNHYLLQSSQKLWEIKNHYSCAGTT
ncbi:hypothetical protein ACGMNB_20420 [Shewanella oncorhynchi]|uniref:hypothetical protein n=1 Tax=Shewanella oncorhynchi TaxID=2726434 RepID=UPI0037450B4A